jgi:UDP-N-acetyl-D-mannosaminuronate dehydrogenase
LTDEVLADQDCVCVAVAHNAFDIAWIVKHSRLLVDATGVTRRMSPAGGMVIRL